MAAAMAFGTLAIIAKLAYRTGVDEVPLLAVRFLVAAVILGIYRRATRRAPLPRPAIVRLALLGAVAYGGESTLFFVALKLAPASVVSLVFYSYPLWTSVIGFATGIEPFRWRLVGALALGLAGVVVIFTIPSSGLAGPLIALLAAICVSGYYILAQVLTAGVPPPASAAWTATGAALALGSASLVTGRSLPVGALGYAAALGVATAVAFVLMFAAIERIGSSRSAIASTMEPVTTVILAALLLGESLTWRVGLGAVLVVSTLPVLAIRRATRTPVEPTPRV